MEAAGSSEVLVLMWENKWFHIQEKDNFNIKAV
jgi:hypothetical protein